MDWNVKDVPPSAKMYVTVTPESTQMTADEVVSGKKPEIICSDNFPATPQGSKTVINIRKIMISNKSNNTTKRFFMRISAGACINSSMSRFSQFLLMYFFFIM